MTRFSQIATGGGPRPPASASRNEIEDELRDHLACRQAELEAAGLAPDAAAAEAERQFGNPARIARELYWLHNGDRIMTQRLMWVAVVCVILALMAALYMQNRQYQIMLQHQQALAAELAAKTQAALAAVKDGMPTATLRLRVVDEDGKPRAGRQVEIRGVQPSPQLSGATFSLFETSDADGWINSGALPLGEYVAKDIYPELNWGKHSVFAAHRVSLFRAGEVRTTDFLVPVVTRRTLVFQPPDIPEGYTLKGHEPAWSIGDKETFGAGRPFQFNVPVEVACVRNASLEIFVNLTKQDRLARLSQVRKSWLPDAIPEDGETVALGIIGEFDGRPRFVDAPATSRPADE